MRDADKKRVEAWGTKDETRFIRGLSANPKKRHLLRGYVAGLALRENWDGMDKVRVLARATEELRRVKA